MLVSVIIPVYNGAGYIPETLESVRRQTCPDWECIIIDDGSTDNTAGLVRQVIAGDDRFVYHYQRNQGLSAARNSGLDRAKGRYIQFLDADDILLPLKLEEQVREMKDKLATVSHTDYRTGAGADIYQPAAYYRPAQFLSSEPLAELIARWESSLVIPPHCWLFDATVFRESKIRFDTALPNHEDFDCWVNIFRLSPRLAYLDKKLVIYRISEGSMSRNMARMGEGFLQVLQTQRAKKDQPSSLIRVIDRKRRETLKRYNRFDLMTLTDKLFSFPHIVRYYTNRLIGKR